MRPVFLAFAVVLLFSASAAMAGSTANHTVTVTVSAINEVAITGGNLTLTILEGTTATLAGEAMTALTAEVVNPSPPPPGSHLIGLAYDFGPDGAEFSPPISIAVSYDPASLPEGAAAANLALAYFDTQSGSWVTVPGTVDTVAGTVTGQVGHFTTFSVIAATGAAAGGNRRSRRCSSCVRRFAPTRHRWPKTSRN